MKRLILPLLGLVGLMIGLLSAGCAAQPEITPAAAPPTPAAIAGGQGANGEEAEPAMEVASRFPLPAPAREEAVRADNSNCIDCHTDQEALQELAEEPEEIHLSEGEG